MKLIREIVVYQKQGDKLIESFEIDLSVDELIDILNVNKLEDPEVYMVYKINQDQYSKFKYKMSNLKEIDFNNFEIFYECYKI